PEHRPLRFGPLRVEVMPDRDPQVALGVVGGAGPEVGEEALGDLHVLAYEHSRFLYLHVSRPPFGATNLPPCTTATPQHDFRGDVWSLVKVSGNVRPFRLLLEIDHSPLRTSAAVGLSGRFLAATSKTLAATQAPAWAPLTSTPAAA